MTEFKNVTLSYGKNVIVDDISFTAYDGEITVLLGKNGSGKTTLFRAASGTLPYSGSIRTNSKEIKELRPSERAKLISVMPQNPGAPEITVRELISYGRQPYTGFCGILSEKDIKTVDHVIDEMSLAPIADKLINRISGGERQKAYFAMLWAQDTPCILLDEPASHLDAENINELCCFLQKAKAVGKTVLTVMHDINKALSIADRILVLNDGCLVFNGTPEELCKKDIIQNIFSLKRFEYIAEDGSTRYIFI